MRVLLLSLLIFGWTVPSLADEPAAGDLIYFDAGTCSLRHLDPSTGAHDVISQWECWGATGTTVGTGPTDWTPSDGGNIFASPDGWIYVHGFGPAFNENLLYRIDPATGNREFITAIPASSADSAFGYFIWPGPSFFTPTVAALSGGAVALLVGLIAGTYLRSGRRDTRRTREARDQP